MSVVSSPLRRFLTPLLYAFAFCLTGIVLTQTALFRPFVAIALGYIAAFVTLAWKRPDYALALIFISAPFQTDVSSGAFAKFSVAEINLGLLFPLLFVRSLLLKQPICTGPILLPVGVYFGVCLYSSLQTWRDNTASNSLLQMVLYLIVAVSLFASFVRSGGDASLCLRASVVLGVVFSLLGLATNFQFMGMNKNGMGSSLGCLLLIALELWFQTDSPRRKRLLLSAVAIIAAGLLFSLSRGAWLGALSGMIVLTALRRQFKMLFRLMAILVPVVIVSWNFLPQESREYAVGFDAKRVNIKLRYASVEIARGYFDKSPLYGQGVGLRKTYDATNLVWLTLAETGILGVVALAWIHIAFLLMIWQTQRHLSREDPLYSFMAVGGALVICKLMHGMVDHYWSRGPIMMAWAAAGMATGAYYIVRQSNLIEATHQ